MVAGSDMYQVGHRVYFAKKKSHQDVATATSNSSLKHSELIQAQN